MVSFYESMKTSYAFDESTYKECGDFRIVENLYNKYYIEKIMGDNKTNHIPRKIHQVWLGGNLPIAYKKITSTWKKYHPEWDYKLWTDQDIADFGLINIDNYNKTKNVAIRSDILRYEILYKEGGLYVDTDFECLKSFEDLIYLNFFSGMAYTKELLMYNGLMASIPGSNIMKSCIENIKSVNDSCATAIFNSTGPQYFTKIFLETIKKECENIVSFPVTYFYPYPNSEAGKLDPKYIKTYIKPESYAVHQWHVSWRPGAPELREIGIQE